MRSCGPRRDADEEKNEIRISKSEIPARREMIEARMSEKSRSAAGGPVLVIGISVL
jgi:hypothetical protein